MIKDGFLYTGYNENEVTNMCSSVEKVHDTPLKILLSECVGDGVNSIWSDEAIERLRVIMNTHINKTLSLIETLMVYRKPEQAIGVVVKDFSGKCLSPYHVGVIVYVTEDDGNVCNVSIPYEDGGDVSSLINCHSTVVSVPCCHVRIIKPSIKRKMGGLYIKSSEEKK